VAIEKTRIRSSTCHEIALVIQQKDNVHTHVQKADRADFPTETFLLGVRDFSIQGVAIKIVERNL